MLQRLPFEQLHGDEVPSIELVDLMDGADVRVVQGRGGPRFPLKALNRLAIARVFCRQKLQGDVAPEFDVLGFVHYTHATTAQFFQDAVVGYGLVDQVEPPAEPGSCDFVPGRKQG